MILSSQRFLAAGCPNCEEFLGLAGNSDTIQDCTSQVFDGVITLTDPRSSWVAKWQRLSDYAPGTYAVRVTGIVRSTRCSRLLSSVCVCAGD